jgi:ribosomal protein S3
MILNIVIGENTVPVDVPNNIINEAGSFFDQMDLDLDKGQMVGRDWVDSPNIEQRCQIVADRLLTALETENESMRVMMAAYILNRIPGIKGVRVAIDGEINESEVIMDVSQF